MRKQFLSFRFNKLAKFLIITLLFLLNMFILLKILHVRFYLNGSGLQRYETQEFQECRNRKEEAYKSEHPEEREGGRLHFLKDETYLKIRQECEKEVSQPYRTKWVWPALVPEPIK